MAYCYDGKTYETIKEMAEEYGIDRKEYIPSGAEAGR